MNYEERKKQGLVDFKKVASEDKEVIQLTVKQFDSTTGEEKEPQVQLVIKEDLLRAKALKEDELQHINDMLAKF